MSLGYIFLWLLSIVGLALQLGLFIFLLKAKDVRKYLTFVIYTGFVVITNPISSYLYESRHAFAYFYFYYIQDFICIVLALIIQHDILIRIFEQFEGIKAFGLKVFYGSVLALIIVAVSSSVSFVEHAVHPDTQIINRAEAALRFIQVGTVLFLLFFMRTLTLVWNRQFFSIAFGFGFYATTALLFFVCRMQYGRYLENGFGSILNVAYFGTQLLWAVSLMHTTQEQKTVALPNFQHIDKWNRLLSNI